MRRLQLFFYLIHLLVIQSWLMAQNTAKVWQYLEEGLYLGIFDAPIKSKMGDSKITVLKIDPAFFDINIYCASEYQKKLRTARDWALEFGLSACINAGMYATDYLTSVGYLKCGSHLNNPYINKAYNSIFACDPVGDDVPPIKLIDRRCEDFSQWKDKYNSFSQSIRMISCHRKNVWKQQPRQWSIAALGIDQSGNLLLIHCRSPYSVHDFINMLLVLPLDIQQAMYLEGGPEASLYFRSKNLERELVGSYETSFLVSNDNRMALKIPNIIGIKRKSN